MQTPLTDLFDLRIPLIQAPMAGVSTPELAAAVSNAGALGSVALGALSAEQAELALTRTMALTKGPVAANVFVHPAPRRDRLRERRLLDALTPLFGRAGARPPAELREIYRSFNENDDMLEMLLTVKPAAVSFHFGPGTPDRVAALQHAGIRVLATATSVAEARLLVGQGIDLVVLQHFNAGGHSGAFLEPPIERGTLTALVADTAAAIDVPVVAAGGLMDGADIRRVLDAGAAGAQLGTAFVGCPETLASESYRSWLRRDPGTTLTDRISGRPARGLNNPLMQALQTLQSVADYPLTYDAIKQLITVTADPEVAAMWAGTGAGRCRFLPAAELVAILAAELADAAY